MVLIVDNYGSSVNTIASMIRSIGKEIHIEPDKQSFDIIDIGGYESVILTPGPGAKGGMRLSTAIIRNKPHPPLLGICNSMHLIVSEAGGIINQYDPVFVEDSLSHTGDNLFNGIPQRFRVVLRQNRVIKKNSLPDFFEIDAFSSDGSVQGFSYDKKNEYGIGFDPASFCTEYGIRIISNFLNQH